VIGSVAAYLSRHGWARGRPVVGRAHPDGDRWRALLTDGLKPTVTPAAVRHAGLSLASDPRDGEHLNVFKLAGAEGPEVWIGWPNFYVITRYNHSALYAMVVYQLAQRIREVRAETAGR